MFEDRFSSGRRLEGGSKPVPVPVGLLGSGRYYRS